MNFKVLASAGITESDLRRLHTLGLTHTLREISGVGDPTYNQILSALADPPDDQPTSDQPPSADLLPSRLWVYRFALDLLRIPQDAAELCRKQSNGLSLLEMMRDINTETYNAVLTALKALSDKQYNPLLEHYRSQRSDKELSSKYRLPASTIAVNREKTLATIRRHHDPIIKALVDATFLFDVRSLLGSKTPKTKPVSEEPKPKTRNRRAKT